MSKYLVRTRDFHIFEVDESNNCYRSYLIRNIVDSNGLRPNARSHFTFDNLTTNFGFIAIEVDELNLYERLNNHQSSFQDWQTRSDGHGGVKGGTYEEYLTSIEK